MWGAWIIRELGPAGAIWFIVFLFHLEAARHDADGTQYSRWRQFMRSSNESFFASSAGAFLSSIERLIGDKSVSKVPPAFSSQAYILSLGVAFFYPALFMCASLLTGTPPSLGSITLVSAVGGSHDTSIVAPQIILNVTFFTVLVLSYALYTNIKENNFIFGLMPTLAIMFVLILIGSHFRIQNEIDPVYQIFLASVVSLSATTALLGEFEKTGSAIGLTAILVACSSIAIISPEFSATSALGMILGIAIAVSASIVDRTPIRSIFALLISVLILGASIYATIWFLKAGEQNISSDGGASLASSSALIPTAIVFLLIPSINALFDWVSLGTTRWLLKFVAAGKHEGIFSFVWIVVDLLIAIALIIGLAVTLTILLSVLDVISLKLTGSALLNTSKYLREMSREPFQLEYFWVYAMIASTLAWSVVFVLFSFGHGVFTLFAPARSWGEMLINRAERGEHLARVWLSMYFSLPWLIGTIILQKAVQLIWSQLSLGEIEVGLGDLISNLALMSEQITQKSCDDLFAAAQICLM